MTGMNEEMTEREEEGGSSILRSASDRESRDIRWFVENCLLHGTLHVSPGKGSFGQKRFFKYIGFSRPRRPNALFSPQSSQRTIYKFGNLLSNLCQVL